MLSTNIPLSIPKSNRIVSPVAFFANREAEIDTVVNILKGEKSSLTSGKRCVIRGGSGTGKTELCRAVAHQLLQEYSDAQIYFKIKGNDSVVLSLFKILETIIHLFDPLAQISDDLDLLYAQYLSVLNEKRVLIILDDLPSGYELNWLTPPSSCALLITTHENLEIPDVYSISLRGLSQENSERLLISICPRIGRSAATLSSLCQNLPVNLCLVAGYLNCRSEIGVDDFISELKEHFEQLRHAKKNHVERLLSYLVEQLSAKERSLLSQLAVVGDGFSKELAMELISLEDNNENHGLQTYLNAFTSLNFLTYDQEQSYYRMQPIIQDFALKSLDNAPEVWYRLGKIFTTSIKWYNSLANSSAEGYLLSALVFDEHKTTIKNILQYLRNHSSAERDRIFLDFYDSIFFFGNTRFATKVELAPLLEAMIEASIRLHDKDRIAAILGQLSKIYLRLGEEEKALEYSKLQDRIIQNGQREGTKEILDYIHNSRSANQWIFDTQDQIASESMPLALEEFSTKKTKIILTGFMGTGKTTVGKHVPGAVGQSASVVPLSPSV